jgi:hypothetical protein
VTNVVIVVVANEDATFFVTEIIDPSRQPSQAVGVDVVAFVACYQSFSCFSPSELIAWCDDDVFVSRAFEHWSSCGTQRKAEGVGCGEGGE